MGWAPYSCYEAKAHERHQMWSLGGKGEQNRYGTAQRCQIVYQAMSSQMDSACSKSTVGGPSTCLCLPQCHFSARGFTGLASISPSSPSTSDYFGCAKAPPGGASVSP